MSSKQRRELSDIHAFIGKHFEMCEFRGCDTDGCKTAYMQSWTLVSYEGEADRYRCSICALKEMENNAEQNGYIEAQAKYDPNFLKQPQEPSLLSRMVQWIEYAHQFYAEDSDTYKNAKILLAEYEASGGKV